MIVMNVKNDGNPSTHFGRQMKKERTAQGWTLRDFAARTGIDIGQASGIENGRRPPTEKVAIACDEAFPHRRGWFMEFYTESKSWALSGFRDWREFEDKAARLGVWSPSVLHGLLQTAEYARAVLETSLGVTAEIVSTRLAARMERQKRVLLRDNPPEARFIIDECSLHRLVGSPQVMTGQMRHLLAVAEMPTVTMQILPAVAHPAGASGFIVADDVGYCEHVLGGFVYTDAETVTSLRWMLDTLRDESYRVSESLATIERLGETSWTGESPAIPTRTAGTA
jgi:transcriptional regulator with XRE-family HTH domain